MIQAEYVATTEQVADIMTKSLGSEKFHYFRVRIGVGQ